MTTTEPLAAIAPAPAGEVRLIAIEQLHESPLNPRQIYPQREMDELVASMRANNWRAWQPTLVRPLADGAFELGAGHRRLRAARIAGITHVPCIVQEMSETEFLDVLNFDNSQRADVHPIHEAAGWRVWMERTGLGVRDIAARIGQSQEYVYQRLKYDDLIEPARLAFLDGRITAGHAILIARLEDDKQTEALRYCAPDWDSDRHISVRQLAEWIDCERPAPEEALEEPPWNPPDARQPTIAAPAPETPQRAAAPASIPVKDSGNKSDDNRIGGPVSGICAVCGAKLATAAVDAVPKPAAPPAAKAPAPKAPAKKAAKSAAAKKKPGNKKKWAAFKAGQPAAAKAAKK